MSINDGVVRIKPLVALADDLQSRRYPTETQLHLASKLYASLEAWEVALAEKTSFDLESERIYFFSYDSFHYANALKLLSETMPEGLAEIHSTMEKVMKAYSRDLEVRL